MQSIYPTPVFVGETKYHEDTFWYKLSKQKMLMYFMKYS